MKISKLFHWLYGVLMLLPVMAILTNCLFAIFNKNAFESMGNVDILNIFYYSLDQIHDNVMFSWCNTSFLVTPIAYITDLFGMPSTSPIITMLSYWLNISIIWLVFDLIMYIPLLVHRWLDKGVLE